MTSPQRGRRRIAGFLLGARIDEINERIKEDLAGPLEGNVVLSDIGRSLVGVPLEALSMQFKRNVHTGECIYVVCSCQGPWSDFTLGGRASHWGESQSRWESKVPIGVTGGYWGYSRKPGAVGDGGL